jgi:DNA-directed RNA polymerase subunit RPC12/RpoP
MVTIEDRSSAMNDGGIPEAKCPKCGDRSFGWALLDPKHQKCKKCGAQLEILNKQGAGDHNIIKKCKDYVQTLLGTDLPNKDNL